MRSIDSIETPGADSSSACYPERAVRKGGTVEIEIARKAFRAPAQPLQVLRNIRLTIHPGEFVCIVGGSGCGKTTLLRIVAGLETDFEGTVSLDGCRITGPSLERGVVFQEHRLLPWLTVRENVAFGKTGRKKAEKYKTEKKNTDKKSA